MKVPSPGSRTPPRCSPRIAKIFEHEEVPSDGPGIVASNVWYTYQALYLASLRPAAFTDVSQLRYTSRDSWETRPGQNSQSSYGRLLLPELYAASREVDVA